MRAGRPIDSEIELRLKRKKIIIVGIVRNIEKTLLKDMERLESAFAMFGEINWFLVESGSSDDSRNILENISKLRNNFSYLVTELIDGASRTENMASARNFYLDFLQRDQKSREFSYVAVADFNNLNDKINYHAVESCWTNDDWDVVTANQSGRYYDLWALRHPLWSPNDCWEQHAFYRRYMKFPESAVTFSMRSRMLRIPRHEDWIEVDSAFGGLAIYKSSILNSNARYNGITSEGKRICEHVSFNLALKAEGARIFVNPSLINTRITDHSRRLSLVFTLLRLCRYPLNLIVNKRQNA